MYNDHFGFRCTPFDDRADTQFTVVTPELDEVLAGLEYEARFGKGVALVIGDAGVGKTQTLRSLLLRLHSTDHAVVGSVPPSGEYDPIREACKGFGISLPSSGGQLSRRMARLRRHLSRNAQARHRSIFILDQAENLTPAALSQVATLTELQDERGRLLCVFLFGQPRLLRLLEESEFARLRQQFTGERYLHALDEGQTADYIRHRLRVAGAGDPELIDKGAMHLIFAASRGVPRLINHFTHEALVTAYAAESAVVTAAMVEEVIGATESRSRGTRLEELGLSSSRVGSLNNVSMQGVAKTTEHTARQERVGNQVTAHRAAMPVATARAEQTAARSTFASGVSPTARGDWDLEQTAVEAFGSPSAFEGSGIALSAGAPAALSNSLETLFSQGSDLLERLERVLAKAERTCSVSEASLSQHAAVEKHLSTLSTGAERVLRALGETMEQAERAAREAPRRLEDAVLATEGRLAQIDGKLAAMSQMEDRVGQRAVRIETLQKQVAAADERMQEVLRALDATTQSAAEQTKRLNDGTAAATRIQPEAERIRARMSAQARESESQAAAIEERQRRSSERARELRAELEAMDAKSTTLIEATARQFDGLVRESRERVQAQLVELRRAEEIVGRVEAELSPIAERAAERFREKLDGLQQSAVEGVRGTLEALSRKREDASGLLLEMEAGARTLQARSEAALARIESMATPIVERTVARCREQLQEQAETLQRIHEEKLAASVADHRAHVEAFVLSVQRQVAEVTESLDGLEERKRLLEGSIAPMTETISDASVAVRGVSEKADAVRGATVELTDQTVCLRKEADRLGEVVATLRGAVVTEAATIDALTRRVASMRAGADEAVARTRAIVVEAEAARNSVEATRQGVSASVETITQAAERVGGLCEQVATWERTAVQIERGVALGQACATDLKGATESAVEVRRALQALTTESAERVGQLDSHNASASRVRNELAEANVAANVALQRMESERRTLDGLLRGAKDVAERYSATQATANETVRQLDELIEIAQSAYRRADDAIVNVEERTSELATSSKAAEDVLQRISEHEHGVEQIIARAEQATHKAESTASTTTSTVDRLLQDVWSLTGKTETAAKQLESANVRASELVTKLVQAAGPADAVVQKLSKQMTEADGQYQRIVRDAQEAKKLAERVASVTQVLAGARDAEASIQQTASDVLSLQDRFAALVTQAAQQSVSLRELLSSVQTMTAEQDQARSEAEGIMRRLDDHRSTTQAAAQAGEELLRGFVAQSEALESQLKELGGRVGEIERNVRQALSQRDTTVDQARAQTAQLERVGDAVRKVFAAVSQATLEARERAKELTGVNRSSAEKIAVFTAETQRATDTLHEWVREAVRAQERLERTLRTAPSIQQTHPRESMARLDRTASTLPGSVDSSSIGELRSVTAPVTKERASTVAPAARPPHHVGRAGEIAQLIEDAKRATVEAK